MHPGAIQTNAQFYDFARWVQSRHALASAMMLFWSGPSPDFSARNQSAATKASRNATISRTHIVPLRGA